jgi:hypothetical protein
MRQLKKNLLLAVMLGGLLLSGLFSPLAPRVFAQQPTGSVPTVTGTPEGPIVRVDPSIKTQIRVWAGPSSLGEYPAIGVLLANETAPALARAKGKPEWIQIYYPGVPGSVGWVWSIYLVAAFIGQQTPTRLPTFTPPPPIDLPQFTDTDSNPQNTGVPTGLLILTLGLFGFFGVVLSYLRGR